MKDTKYPKPEGMKNRVKTDIIWDLYHIPGNYYKFQNMSLAPEIYSLEEVQDAAVEHGVPIFENKKLNNNLK